MGIGKGFREARCRLAAALAALLPTMGCSFVSVAGPPPGAVEDGGGVECTAESAAPALDAVAAIGLAGLSLPLLLARDTCDGSRSLCIDLTPQLHAAGAVLLGTSALALLSGQAGRAAIARCRSVKGLGRCDSPDSATCRRLGFPATEPPLSAATPIPTPP